MEIDVTNPLEKVVIGATGAEEIVQNVRTILTTVKGSVPLDRTFGIDMAFVDLPGPAAMARLTAAVVEEVEKQEPRVMVTAVRWPSPGEAGAMDGRLIPVVRIMIRDGVLNG